MWFLPGSIHLLTGTLEKIQREVYFGKVTPSAWHRFSSRRDAEEIAQFGCYEPSLVSATKVRCSLLSVLCSLVLSPF
jgi:hypothetical protein